MSSLPIKSIEHPKLSERESAKLIPVSKQPTIDQFLKPSQTSTCKRSSCVQNEEFTTQPPSPIIEQDEKSNLDESIEDILSPQYNDLAITPMSKLSVAKSIQDGISRDLQREKSESSKFSVDQHSIWSMTRKERLQHIREDMKNKKFSSISSQSPQTPTQKVNRTLDQSAILKQFSNPSTSRNLSKIKFFAEGCPPSPKFKVVSTPSVVSSTKNFSRDNTESETESTKDDTGSTAEDTKFETSSQASTVVLNLFEDSETVNKPSNMFFNEPQNFSQRESFRSVSNLNERKDYRRSGKSSQRQKENQNSNLSSYYNLTFNSLSSNSMSSTLQRKKESQALSENVFRQPAEKKRKIERRESNDVRMMTSSAVKEAEIFRKIEGEKFDENMFYENVDPDEDQSSIDEDQLSLCQCGYTTSQSSSNY